MFELVFPNRAPYSQEGEESPATVNLSVMAI
jgi:hypothetical protein